MKIKERIKDRVFKNYKTVTCIYCGEEIDVQDESEDIEYVVTKLGNVLFFHTRCYNSKK